jgi:hypothetical protein
MPTKTARRAKSPASPPRRREPRQPQPAPVPTWRNTHPRGNPEVDAGDLSRSRERFEALLGR